jgi:hypothetical protein
MPEEFRMPTDSENKSQWPVSDMLLRGTFATQTVAERRLVVRNKIIGALLFVSVMAARIHPTRITAEIALFMTAGLCTYYAWEKRKYFLSLDELPRRIEMEGMAWAYSIGLLAGLWLAGIGYAVSQRWPLDPKLLYWAPFLLVAILLGLVKGLYRYFAARRY